MAAATHPISSAAQDAPARSSVPRPQPTFGGEIRLRGESFDNVMDLEDSGDDSYQFFRLRYRFWADVEPRDGLQLYFRFGNEYRWGVHQVASIRDGESRISLDNGWAEVGVSAVPGLHLRFGRMDLAYGEGFLIFDGTPADGSSSSYFDAIRLRWEGDPLQADLFAAKLQDEGFGTTARDEDLHGLYITYRGIEAYGLHRAQRGSSVSQPGRPWQVPQPRQRTAAIGTRITRLPPSGWQGALEGAFQFGRYEDLLPTPPGTVGLRTSEAAACACADDRRIGYGGYARGGWVSQGGLRPGLEIGGLYLSGDDRKTERFEGWDDFYGEWPKWSELLIYTHYDGTTRLHRSGSDPRPDDAGAWTNLEALWVEGRFHPTSGRALTVRGTLLRAPEPNGPGTGRERGFLLTGSFDCTRFSGIAIQLLGESFWPGEFYRPDADPAWYARAQIATRF